MSLRRSFAISFSARYIELLMALISSMILARLLSPEEFGIYSIAASVVVMGYLLRNFGVGQFIVQIEQLSDGILRSAFTLTLIISWGIGALVLLCAPWLGQFYSNSGITTCLLLLSINFFLLPFGSISNAVMRRNLAFDKLSIINISAAFTTLVVGTTAAYWGASYLSIVWASIAGSLVSVLMTLIFRPEGLPWLPGVSHLNEAWRFGLKVGFMDLSNKGSDSISELTIGRAQGLNELGVYSRAYGTYRLFEYAFVQAIRPLVLPYLSRAKQEKANLGENYLSIVNLTSIFLMPFFVFFGLNATDIIYVLYGGQWTKAGSILQIMCIAGLFVAPTLFFEQLLIAHGRPGQGLRYVVLSQVLRIVALIGLVEISLEVAALALLVWTLTAVIQVSFMARRYFGLRIIAFLGALRPACLTAIFLALGFWGTASATTTWDVPIQRLSVQSLVALLVWTISVFLLHHPISLEITVIYQKLARRNAK